MRPIRGWMDSVVMQLISVSDRYQLRQALRCNSVNLDDPTAAAGGVSKSMLKKSRLDFDKIEKCE